MIEFGVRDPEAALKRSREHLQVLDRGRIKWQQPAPLNTAGVLWLEDPFRVPFRGRMYEIPPLGYAAGIRAMRLQERLEHVRESNDIEELERWATDAAKLIRANVRPDPRKSYRLWRIRWKLRIARNPFRFANFRELGELLGFCLRSQTRTSVAGAQSTDHTEQSTYSTGSRSSPGRSPRG